MENEVRELKDLVNKLTKENKGISYDLFIVLQEQNDVLVNNPNNIEYLQTPTKNDKFFKQLQIEGRKDGNSLFNKLQNNNYNTYHYDSNYNKSYKKLRDQTKSPYK